MLLSSLHLTDFPLTALQGFGSQDQGIELVFFLAFLVTLYVSLHVAESNVRPSESGIVALARFVSVAAHDLHLASVQDQEDLHSEKPPSLFFLFAADSVLPYPQQAAFVSIPTEYHSSIPVDFFKTSILWDKIQYQQENRRDIWTEDQLRMSDLEFGRLSGGLVHSRSENDAEWEGTDVLSEQREIGVKLEMENERCAGYGTMSRLRFASFASLIALNTASPSTPPRLQHHNWGQPDISANGTMTPPPAIIRQPSHHPKTVIQPVAPTHTQSTPLTPTKAQGTERLGSSELNAEWARREGRHADAR
ncbi:hypothetical protein BLNAU_9141 [Blattamonas nauphoetae]|uniref:Uncharacterized protein n=1 Tax=Blattamonas nauphoetae TaxID=2049346 RepID=A0ABQ9XWG0_9EUKA|nr:hypothetical protein BLNAU_9141 [Blattamonas nauphoetae]